MNKIRELRIDRGLSQAKLAARAELDPSTVNQIERGARDASPLTLRKIAQALGVSLAALIEETDSPKALSRSSHEPSLFSGLEEERRSLDLKFLRAWRAYLGDIWLQWTEEAPPTPAQIQDLFYALKHLEEQGAFDTASVTDEAALDNISLITQLLRKLSEIADAVEQDETARQRRELIEALPGGLSA